MKMAFVPEYCWRWSWAAENGIQLHPPADIATTPLRGLLWEGGEVMFVAELVKDMAKDLAKGEVCDG